MAMFGAQSMMLTGRCVRLEEVDGPWRCQSSRLRTYFWRGFGGDVFIQIHGMFAVAPQYRSVSACIFNEPHISGGQARLQLSGFRRASFWDNTKRGSVSCFRGPSYCFEYLNDPTRCVLCRRALGSSLLVLFVGFSTTAATRIMIMEHGTITPQTTASALKDESDDRRG